MPGEWVVSSVNKVILVGTLGRDPEVRSLSAGKVCNLSVATSERWKDRDGERQERTEWHRVTIYNENLVGVAERFLAKGRQVYIEGQLQTRKWTDQEGHERYSTEVVLSKFRGELVLLGGGQDRESGDKRVFNERRDAPDRIVDPKVAQAAIDAHRPSRRIEQELDDEIPF